MSGQEIVKTAFDSLTLERQHDIMLGIGIHDEPCDICEQRSRVVPDAVRRFQ